MDYKLKQAALLLALGFSSSALAGTYTPPVTPVCNALPVSIPCDSTGWDFAAEVYYAQPMNDDLWYGNIISGTANAPVISQVFADRDFDWGFGLEGSFHFNTGNDVAIRWMYFNNDNDSTFVVPNGSAMQLRMNNNAPTLLLPLGAATATSGRVVTRYDFDSVHAEFGQHIDVGNEVDMRVHFGATFVDLNHRLDYSSMYAVNQVLFVNEQIGTVSKFDGVGPRAGIDAGYVLGNGFSLVGRGATALLVGDLKSSIVATYPVNSNAISPTAGFLSGVAFTETKERVVVPNANGKLGINLSVDCFDGMVMFEGGWQWTGYFQAIRHRFTDLSNGVMQSTSNFALQGPYLSIKYID